jgi:hypothetical protein
LGSAGSGAAVALFRLLRILGALDIDELGKSPLVETAGRLESSLTLVLLDRIAGLRPDDAINRAVVEFRGPQACSAQP